MKKCSRWQKCSVPKCPLDVDIDLRVELKGVKGEEKCGMEKNVRLRIGTELKLPKLGLTDRELSFRQNWESKSEEEKIKIKERLAETAFKKRD